MINIFRICKTIKIISQNFIMQIIKIDCFNRIGAHFNVLETTPTASHSSTQVCSSQYEVLPQCAEKLYLQKK